MVSRTGKTTQEHGTLENKREPRAEAAVKRESCAASPANPAAMPFTPETTQESMAARPPLRKYIRKVGAPGHERTVVEVVAQKPKEITLASLKEKFGLTEAKLGGAIQDAERFGHPRRAANGPYAWDQKQART